MLFSRPCLYTRLHVARTYATKTSVFPTRTIRALLSDPAASSTAPDANVTVRGWIRSVRQQKQVSFANINDGSTLKGIQAILKSNDASK